VPACSLLTLSLPGGGRLISASLLRACVPSLAVPWAPLVSPVDHSLARFFCYVGPAYRNCLPPNHLRSPLWMRPRPCVSRPRPHAPEPFLEPAHTHLPSPAQWCPQPSTLTLSLALRAHEARRGLSPILWPPLSFCRAPCLDELHPFASNVGHLLVRPQHLWFTRSTLIGFLTLQPQLRRRRPEVSPRPYRCSSSLESPPEVSNFPMPLIPRVLPCHSCNCSLERACSVVGPLRRGLHPLVPLRWCCAYVSVRRVTRSALEPFPNALDPSRGRALASGETSPRRRAVTPRVDQPPGPCLPIGSRTFIQDRAA
jgi:hypothetical protein